MSQVSLPDEVRAACAWVAGRARSVRIDEARIAGYASELGEPGQDDGEFPRDPEATAGFAICMNAINFGSGWWPTVRKRAGLSGYGTMAAGVKDRFAIAGAWSTEELAAMDAASVAIVLRQDPEHPLMAEFAAALRDVGRHLSSEHGSRYRGVVEGADSIPDLAAVFAGWESFADVSSYDGCSVPFYKRAQLAAADLHRAGVALWNRGRDLRYKSLPRPRSRNTAY